MDANKINLCGEESFGTGSNHIREKDGTLGFNSIFIFKFKTYAKIKPNIINLFKSLIIKKIF